MYFTLYVIHCLRHSIQNGRLWARLIFRINGVFVSSQLLENWQYNLARSRILAIICLAESEMYGDYNRMICQIGNEIDSIKLQKTQNIRLELHDYCQLIMKRISNSFPLDKNYKTLYLFLENFIWIVCVLWCKPCITTGYPIENVCHKVVTYL